MTVCGHQFHGGDATDWILSTSASCLLGSTTANQILQELFKRQITDESGKSLRKKSVGIKTRDKKQDDARVENKNVKHGFEDFDKSQHLSGCPMKWLYNKKLLEKNKRYKIDRICYKNLAKKEEFKRDKCKNLRDKTPAEVKIHKINLIEKYTSNYEESYAPFKIFGKKPENGDGVEFETHRRKLAAKLNWKLHDENPDDSSTPLSELKHDYLPPRPMLGLKPFLSLLLAPNQITNCCSLAELAKNSAKKEKITSSLSIQSLDLPDFPPQNPHPRNSNTSRWGSKSSRLSKKLQLPTQITIDLDRKDKGGLKIAGCSPSIKKSSDKPKQPKSLSALFYELRGKSNLREESEDRVEDMLKDLTMEGRFKIRRFLNIGTEDNQVDKVLQLGEDKQKPASVNLICGKIRFFEKKPKSAVRNPDDRTGYL